MSKSKMFKKRKGEQVPDELPDLAVDDLKKDLEEAVSGELASIPEKTNGDIPVSEGETIPENSTVEPAPVEEIPAVEEPAPVEEIPAEPVAEEVPVEEEIVDETTEKSPLDPNKSFFNTLSKELEKDDADISKLNEWYKERFPKGDALEDMKEYWEDKKDELIVESLGKEYKAKIKESMKNLQKLEGDWQKIYFDLVTKEEEMKNQEKHLRETINEFTRVVKKRSEDKKDKPTSKKRKDKH